MLNHGFIGIGQGGCNLVEVFAQQFPAIAINTARQDLDGLQHIPEDLRIFTDVSQGGAGKDIRIGERAIIQYRPKIKDKIKMVMRTCDYIWIVVGLGGGTGSLGALQLVSILAGLGKKHGLIATLPARDEGTHEKLNALVAISEIQKAHQKSKNFRSMLIIDNESLKRQILGKGSYSYENFWTQANQLVYDNFCSVYEMSQQAAITSFDTEDYKRLFQEKGCMLFAEGEYELDGSETVLASKVKELWDGTLFLAGDPARATGTALIIERPAGFDRDGVAINRLFEEIKTSLGSGLFCRGVYARKGISELVGRKPVRIFTMLAGIPFPSEKLAQLKAEVDQELADIREKQTGSMLDIDLSSMLDFIQENGSEDEAEELDFSVFTKPVDWMLFNERTD